MDKSRQAIRKIIKSKGGIAKTSDFIKEGFSASDVATLCKKRYLKRLKHGYYQLTSDIFLLDEQMLNTLIPGSVVAVESALFHYGYSDFMPREWAIAVPRTFSRSKFRNSPFELKVYYIQPDIFELGKTKEEMNGIEVAIYDRERTICDCFKYYNKLDREIFVKAVQGYAYDHKHRNLGKLMRYARQMKIYDKVLKTMEVLVNE